MKRAHWHCGECEARGDVFNIPESQQAVDSIAGKIIARHTASSPTCPYASQVTVIDVTFTEQTTSEKEIADVIADLNDQVRRLDVTIDRLNTERNVISHVAERLEKSLWRFV